MSRLQRGLSALNRTSGSGTSRLGISAPGGERQGTKSFEELKRLIHSKLVDKLDLSRVSDLEGETLRREIRLVVERLCDTENPLLNRVGLATDISLKKAEETIGKPIFWQVPNDPKVMNEARDQGVPLVQHAPRSKVQQAIHSLAQALTGKGPAQPVKEKSRGWALWK